MRRLEMVETKMLLDDSEISLIEDMLDGYYLQNPQDYTFVEKTNLNAKLQKQEVKLTNDEIFTIWKAVLKADSGITSDEKFDALRGKFEQLNMMLSI
jgi:hypothetical protein